MGWRHPLFSKTALAVFQKTKIQKKLEMSENVHVVSACHLTNQRDSLININLEKKEDLLSQENCSTAINSLKLLRVHSAPKLSKNNRMLFQIALFNSLKLVIM